MQGDAALEQAITRTLTRTEQRKKALVLECYRDYWRRSARPVCPLAEAEAYLVRAADIVVRLRALLVAEGDTGSPDGTAVMKARCEKDVEKAVLECVNHAAMGGNCAEMLWDLEQCPKANPAAFVRDLVDATLRNSDKYVLPNLDEDYLDRFVSTYDRLKPLGSAAAEEDRVSFAEIEAVLASMQKTAGCLADADVPEHSLKEILNSLRDIDEKLASLLPRKRQEVVPSSTVGSASSSSEAETPAATPETTTADVSEAEQPPKQMLGDECQAQLSASQPQQPQQQQQQQDREQEEQKEEDAKAQESEGEGTVTPPVTRQDSCLLKINTISDNLQQMKPKVADIKERVAALDLAELQKDPVEGLRRVEAVQKESRMYSEYLMRDLLALDTISATDETRPLRRTQVIEVQQLMDQMDEVAAKLRGMSDVLRKDPKVIEKNKRDTEASLAAHKTPRVLEQAKQKEKEEKMKEQEKKKQLEEEEKKKQEAQKKQDEAEQETEEEAEGEEGEQQEEAEEEDAGIPDWRSLKLVPRFDVKKESKAYVLTAMIPGLDRDEIGINLSQSPEDGSDELVVSGVRVPTRAELAKMDRQLAEWQRATRVDLSNPRNHKLGLLRLARGRYGAFEERFSLPEDSLPDKIRASYEGGRLGIVIPRAQRQQYQPYPQYSPFASGYDSSPFGSYTGRGGLSGFPFF